MQTRTARATRLALFAIILAAVTGCASTAEHLRSQPTFHFQPTETVQLPDGDIKTYVELHCMRKQETQYAKDAMGNSTEECLYVSANAAQLAKDVPDAKRDKLINYLLAVSDANCSNFLQRAFATKAGLDFAKGVSRDITDGLSAGTAHVNPAAAAALSVSSLIIGKGVDSFNATYYYEKTFEAVKSVIKGNRAAIKRQIVLRQAAARATPSVPYYLSEALSDIREYDDACSIMGGLDRLVQVAGREQADETSKTKEAERSPEAVLRALNPASGASASRR